MNVHDHATLIADSDARNNVGTHALTPNEVLASMLASAGDDEELREKVRGAWVAVYAPRVVEIRALLKTALEVVNEFGAGEDSRSSSPVAPDGSE